MASKAALERLRKEFKRIQKEPVENIEAAPREDNLLEWHYAVYGPKGSVYEGGIYHGKIVFPQAYPYKPPAIYMLTPNGRFKTATRLCLSMSDFHPETWNPLWSVSSILSGLLSFMLEATPTYGSMESDDVTKKELARRSMKFNVKDPLFCKLFPKLVHEYKARVEESKDSESTEDSESTTDSTILKSRKKADDEEKFALERKQKGVGSEEDDWINQPVELQSKRTNKTLEDILDFSAIAIILCSIAYGMYYLYT